MRHLSALLVLLSAIAVSGPVAAADRLKVSIIKLASMTNAWVAKQEGMFAAHGLDVELVEFRNGNEAISAHRGGSVDIMLSIAGTAMTAIERGFDLTLVMQNETAKATAPDAGAIQVLAGSSIQRMGDLNGKKLAISGLHSQMVVSAQTALRKAGADTSKIQLIEMPFPSMGNALMSGQVDAIAVLDPWLTALSEQGKVKTIGWSYVDALPEQPLGTWWATKVFLDKNQDVFARFAKAIQQSLDYMNADEVRARRLVADFTGLDPKLTERMPLIRWNSRIDLRVWEATAAMMLENGELQKMPQVQSFISSAAQPFVAR